MASEILPTFFSDVWNLFKSITVPGFSFTAADMLIGSFLVVLSIVILKAAIRIPDISFRSNADVIPAQNPFANYRVKETSSPPVGSGTQIKEV